MRALGGISAISEGWALYAERMVAQEGWYEGDLEGLLGQLDDELFRARRLVVDTGLHAMRWTRQQAIDYGIEASEVERYVVNPGQACSYKIGQLEIFRLRDKARTALGQRFSIKDFHNVVLSAGTGAAHRPRARSRCLYSRRRRPSSRIRAQPLDRDSRLTASGGSDVCDSHRHSLRGAPMGCASWPRDHRRPHTGAGHRRDDGDLLARGRCAAASRFRGASRIVWLPVYIVRPSLAYGSGAQLLVEYGSSHVAELSARCRRRRRPSKPSPIWQRGRPVALAGTSDVAAGAERIVGVPSTRLVCVPYAGRTFTAAEDDAVSDSVMVSYETWQRRFGGDPAIVGRRITIDEVTRTIVGVLPRAIPIRGRPAGIRVPFGRARESAQRGQLRLSCVCAPGLRRHAGAGGDAGRARY